MYFFSVYKSKRKSATCHETNRKNYYQEVIERINQDILLDFVISNIFVNDRVKIKLYLCTSKFCDIEFIRVFVIKRNI